MMSNALSNGLLDDVCRSVQKTTMVLKEIALQSVKSIFMLPRTQPTHDVHQVPKLFRENYIHSGYRSPDKQWTYYLWSLFQIHNESINIWSHLAATGLFLFKMYTIGQQVDYINDPLGGVLLGFAFGTIAYSLCSTFAHLFQSKSNVMHYISFQIDYIGIGLNAYGNACLLYYLVGTKKYYEIFSPFFMAVNMSLAVLVCVCFSIAKLRYRRPYPMQRKLWQLVSGGIHVAFGGTPLFFKIYDCIFVQYDDCSARAIMQHLEYSFWFIVSTFFFASGIPERFAPGRFDVLGHGHQLFHVIVSYMSLLQYEAGFSDIQNRPKELIELADPNHSTIFGGMLLILVLDSLFIILSHGYRLRKVKEDTKYDNFVIEDCAKCK